MPERRGPLLVKISGEALKAGGDAVLDERVLERVSRALAAAVESGRQLGVVVGGGNIMRGARIAEQSDDPTVGDYMGMLATYINALALRDGIRRAGASCEVVGAQAIANVAHGYNRDQVAAWLADGVVVVFAGGTGHPFFTTDSTAALRAAEIGACELLKASNVDGVYDKDPARHDDARRFERLSFDEAIAGRFAVMDQAAFAICRDRAIPIRIFDMTRDGALAAALGDDPPGTVVGGA